MGGKEGKRGKGGLGYLPPLLTSCYRWMGRVVRFGSWPHEPRAQLRKHVSYVAHGGGGGGVGK